MTVRHDLAPTGVLRVSINLGNPVLVQGDAAAPTGVTVDIAGEVAGRLGVPLQLHCFPSARHSFESMERGLSDLCFLAVDPARQRSVAFTAPYAVIEGAFAVPLASPIVATGDVDRAGVRIAVTSGSAYDLHLSRTLQHASVVRGDEAVAIFLEHHLEVVAGIRGPMAQLAAHRGDLRLLQPSFMDIHQAVGTPADRSADAVRFLARLVEQLKASGFVAEALRRSGRADVAVAGPAG